MFIPCLFAPLSAVLAAVGRNSAVESGKQSEVLFVFRIDAQIDDFFEVEPGISVRFSVLVQLPHFEAVPIPAHCVAADFIQRFETDLHRAEPLALDDEIDKIFQHVFRGYF